MDQQHTAAKAPLQPEQKRHLLRRLYDWTLHWAHTPYGTPALFALAVAESSVFPVPPDVLLIALALSRRRRAFFYALISSVGSVLGGIIGYWIGYAAWHVCEPLFIPYVFSRELFDKVVGYYNAQAFWFVFIAAFTPIPYKVFTIAGGVCRIPIWILLLASAVGRSGRFFLVGGLIYLLGEKVRAFVEVHFDRLMWAFLVLVIVGFIAIKYL